MERDEASSNPDQCVFASYLVFRTRFFCSMVAMELSCVVGAMMMCFVIHDSDDQ